MAWSPTPWWPRSQAQAAELLAAARKHLRSARSAKAPRSSTISPCRWPRSRLSSQRRPPAVLAKFAGRAAGELRPSGRRQSAFQFQCAQAGRRSGLPAQWDEMQLTVHDIVKEFAGSISAEHGIGAMKWRACRATNPVRNWMRCARSSPPSIRRTSSIRERCAGVDCSRIHALEPASILSRFGTGWPAAGHDKIG